MLPPQNREPRKRNGWRKRTTTIMIQVGVLVARIINSKLKKIKRRNTLRKLVTIMVIKINVSEMEIT